MKIHAPVLPGMFSEPDPPFHGATLISRHTSYQGAVDASERVGRQCLAILALYKDSPRTDQEVADAIGIDRSSVNARRATLIKMQLVDPVPKGTKKNAETNISNAIWGLA